MEILSIKVIVPLAGWKDHYEITPWQIKVEPDAGNGLEKISATDTFQVGSLAQKCFIRKRGMLEAAWWPKLPLH